MRRIGPAPLMASVLLAGGCLLPSAAQAQSGEVKTFFEKYNLLGTYANDCTKPATRANFYFVNRLVDADHVQRDRMSGPQTRDFVIVLNQSRELMPNQVEVSGTLDGKPIILVWRLEPGKVRSVDTTLDGKKTVSGGRQVPGGAEVPAQNKCG